MVLPSLNEWLTLKEQERALRVSALNPYLGVGRELLELVEDLFRKEFGHLKGLTTTGLGAYHGGVWVIGATHPLVFDNRLLPPTYLGVTVHKSVSQPLPAEIGSGYAWSPLNFSRFVDRCADEVRLELGSPSMTREEMLHALIGEPYETWLVRCRAWVAEGKIPQFE